MRPALRQTLEQLEEQRQHEIATRSSGSIDVDARMLAVGPDSACFLSTMVHAVRAQRALEIGGSMGYSTIWLGAALEATGGRMTTLEQVPTKIETLRRRIAQAGLEAVIEVEEGDALESLTRLEGPFDLVLVDAWKDDYPAYFDLTFPKLRTGGVMVADNVVSSAANEGIQEYVEKARHHADAQSQLVPIGSGLELTVRLR
jgi:predicted O-methyltransferase YrrM